MSDTLRDDEIRSETGQGGATSEAPPADEEATDADDADVDADDADQDADADDPS